jgi:hypothetical protein
MLLLLTACHLFSSAEVECPKGSACAQAPERKNHPPSAPEVAISPAEPVDDDDLELTVVTRSKDVDGDSVSYRYVWFKNGVEVPGLETSVPADQTATDDVWSVEVYANDGSADSLPGTAEVTIGGKNATPVISSVSITPDIPNANNSLQAVVSGTDPDGDAIVWSYAWFANGVEVTEAGNTDKLEIRYHTPGDHIYVTVTASDGRASSSMSSAEVQIVGPTIVRINNYAHVVVDANRQTLSGTWNLSFYSEGSWLGHLDCKSFWTLSSTAQTNCQNCDFAFTTTYRYDSASSTLGPGCETLAEDGRDKITVSDGYRYVRLNNDTIPLDLVMHTDTGDYAFTYYPQLSAYQGNSYQYVSSHEDTARNLIIDANQYYYGTR